MMVLVRRTTNTRPHASCLATHLLSSFSSFHCLPTLSFQPNPNFSLLYTLHKIISSSMFTRGALPPCGDGCHPQCKALTFGVDGKFTIGLHTDGYKPTLWDGAPDDIDEVRRLPGLSTLTRQLKYHLGLWFSKHPEGFFLWVLDHVDKNVTAKCGDRCEVMFHHHRFLYDSESPRNFVYLTRNRTFPSRPRRPSRQAAGSGRRTTRPSRASRQRETLSSVLVASASRTRFTPYWTKSLPPGRRPLVSRRATPT